MYATAPTSRKRPQSPAPASQAVTHGNLFTYAVGARDTSGRVRTWYIMDARGFFLAEVTTKKGAAALLDLLNAQK